ncbi:hypothetical protein K1719_042384 [Acacia pycnantha]|nr:hypothetical protein K1719_042384 [Acacia pycnantha]
MARYGPSSRPSHRFGSTDSASPPSSSNTTDSSSHYASAPPSAYTDQAAQPPAAKPVIFSKDSTSLFSGGGLSYLSGSRNGKFSYGYSSFKGKRTSMEDFYETRISEVDGQMVAFFAVFDAYILSISLILFSILIPLLHQLLELIARMAMDLGILGNRCVLTVSLASVDKLVKLIVVADPEIQDEEIDGVEFILIPSDRLWIVILNKKMKRGCAVTRLTMVGLLSLISILIIVRIKFSSSSADLSR